MKNTILISLMLVLTAWLHAADQTKTKCLVVVTLDGLRWQEVFTGADSMLLNNKDHVKNVGTLVKKYWNESPEERRNALMPFIWGTVAVNGQIYGNRTKGSAVNVANPYWFSYPGYNEIFTGYPDEKINTNEYGPNPNINVLEFINQQDGYKDKVAAFTSWDAFPDILNEERSGVLVNSAFEKLDDKQDASIDILNSLQFSLPDLFYGIRLDGVTFNFGFEYLKKEQPNVLYIGLDETDDFAHHGDYDYYLNSANYSDRMIGELWQWLQNSEKYKGKTTLLITCDHGRGEGTPGWKSHGSKTPSSDQTWLAVIGPDSPALGEVKEGQYYNTQFACTMSALLGFDFKSNHEAGEIIKSVLGR